MGKGSGGSMKQKDIDRLIQAQIDANRLNQQTPFGSLTYNNGTAVTEFSPQQQALLSQLQQGQLAAGQQGVDQLGGLAGGRAAVEQASFDRAMGLLGPQFQLQEDRLRNRLANQGLPQSSGAFNRELGRFEDTQNRAMEQAALAAVLQGGQEQSRATANALSLLGISAPQGPQFVNVPGIDVPFNQPQGGSNPLLGALGGAAGLAALGPWGAGAGGLLGLFASR